MKNLLVSLLIAVTALSATAADQINLIVNGGPGSNSWLSARDVEPAFVATGFTVDIVSKPGAGGKLAVNYARQEHNYKNLLVVGGGIAKFETVVNTEFKSILDDYEFIGPVLSTPFILAVGPRQSSRTMDGIMSKSVLRIGSPNGAVEYLIKKMQKQHPGKIISVPYKDSGQTLTDLLGGHIDLMIDRQTFFSKNSQVNLTLLSNTTSSTINGIPSVNRWLKDLNISDNANGILISKNADPAYKKKVQTALNSHYNQAEVQNKLAKEGFTIIVNHDSAHNATLVTEIQQLKSAD